MAFSTLVTAQPINDSEKRLTTSDADVVATAVNTGDVDLEQYNKIEIQVATTFDAAAGTETVTTKLQGSLDGTNWYDLPTVSGTGQVGTLTHTGETSVKTDVGRLNYDFSNGSGQAKPRFIRCSSVSSGGTGTKEVSLVIFCFKQLI
jgi:hypothetical protein